jgi:hypothetical protein
MNSYQKKDSSGLDFHTKKFLELIVDIDTLLASDDNFLLGPWLESAKSLAMTEDERTQVGFFHTVHVVSGAWVYLFLLSWTESNYFISTSGMLEHR